MQDQGIDISKEFPSFSPRYYKALGLTTAGSPSDARILAAVRTNGQDKELKARADKAAEAAIATALAAGIIKKASEPAMSLINPDAPRCLENVFKTHKADLRPSF
jgi:hypothetical protein